MASKDFQNYTAALTYKWSNRTRHRSYYKIQALRPLQAGGSTPQLPPSLPSTFFPLPSLSHPSPSIPSLSGVARKCSYHSPFPSPLLRSRPHIAAKVSGGALKLPSGSGRSPATKRLLVHFKHYFHRERIEKQISNSKIWVLICNRTYRVLHNKVRANLRREKTKFIAKKFHARTIGGISPPGSKWRQFASFSRIKSMQNKYKTSKKYIFIFTVDDTSLFAIKSRVRPTACDTDTVLQIQNTNSLYLNMYLQTNRIIRLHVCLTNIHKIHYQRH